MTDVTPWAVGCDVRHTAWAVDNLWKSLWIVRNRFDPLSTSICPGRWPYLAEIHSLWGFDLRGVSPQNRLTVPDRPCTRQKGTERPSRGGVTFVTWPVVWAYECDVRHMWTAWAGHVPSVTSWELLCHRSHVDSSMSGVTRLVPHAGTDTSLPTCLPPYVFSLMSLSLHRAEGPDRAESATPGPQYPIWGIPSAYASFQPSGVRSAPGAATVLALPGSTGDGRADTVGHAP